MTVWSTALVATFSAALGALLTLGFGFLRARLDAQINQSERLCIIIFQAADLAVEYWLLERSTANGGLISVGNAKRLAILEAFLMGQQAQILQFIELLEPDFPDEVRCQVRIRLPDLLDALTGGNFMNNEGARDPARALIVQTVAADITVAVRFSATRVYTFRFVASRIWRNLWNRVRILPLQSGSN